MTELYLLRHADAGDPEAWTGDDADRPLSGKGEKQSERLGRFLAGTAFRADVFLTSPKVRALRTAEIVAERLGSTATVEDRLAGGLDAGVVDAILRDRGDPDRAVLVGHDPDFTELLQSLTASTVEMKKGAMARIDIDRPLEDGAGRLAWLVPPDLLKPAR
jgi:phosphohistidine phosphatase SixA